MDANDEGASGWPKNKAAKKSSVKQILSHDEEEEGYTLTRIPGMSIWYVLVIHHPSCIFEKLKDTS